MNCGKHKVNPPGIFRECSGDTYNDWYECCLNVCDTPQQWCRDHCRVKHNNSPDCLRVCKMNDENCKYSCQQVWPFFNDENPYKKCAQMCFSNGFKRSCITENEVEIRECCMRNCNPNLVNFDCERFCNKNQIVMYK